MYHIIYHSTVVFLICWCNIDIVESREELEITWNDPVAISLIVTAIIVFLAVIIAICRARRRYINQQILEEEERKRKNNSKSAQLQRLQYDYEVAQIENEINLIIQSQSSRNQSPLSQTPIHTTTRKSTSSTNELIPKCSICLETYSKSDVRYLQCAHGFHIKCIKKWLRKKRKCPLCLTEVPKGSKLKNVRRYRSASVPRV